jgi:TctA family transporter
MEIMVGFLNGLMIVLTPQKFLFVFLGCVGGTVIGVLPGLGPVTTIALLLPITYYVEPSAGIMMLAGVFYGAQYGGSTSAILIRIPGESSSIVTCLDGHEMARQGRAGPALSIAALASLFAGVVATFLIAVFAPLLSRVGQNFGAPEFFSLTTLGLVGVIMVGQEAILKVLAMMSLGLLIGMIGLDHGSGTARYTFGYISLVDGIDFVPLSIGLFSLCEVIANAGRPSVPRVNAGKLKLYPSREDLMRSAPAAARGTAVGCLVGLLPGGGATLSSFMAYFLERNLSSRRAQFGRGAVEGVAAPEAANNAAAQMSFIPLLTLGIPSNAVMASMLAALAIHGIQPGPALMKDHPDLFWGVVASMLVGNIMLVVLNLPLIGLWVRLLSIPYRLLYPAVVIVCAIGVYAVRSDPFDVLLAAGIGTVGIFLLRHHCEPAPLLVGFVLGPMLERNLRRSLLISGGDPWIFVQRPLSAVLLLAAVALIAGSAILSLQKTQAEVEK